MTNQSFLKSTKALDAAGFLLSGIIGNDREIKEIVVQRVCNQVIITVIPIQ